jgi:hypothetical protein
MQIIVLQSLRSLRERGLNFPDEYRVFIDKMNSSDENIKPMSKLLANYITNPNLSIDDKQVMFRSACDIYLDAVQGIFDELTKLIYALTTISESKIIPNSEELNSSKKIWKIYRVCKKNFGIKPVFLKNFKEKRYIRNAIAHSQAKYDPKLDQAYFISIEPETGKIIYDGKMTFAQFFIIWLEIADAIDAFRYTMRLIGVMEDLIALFALSSKS